MIQEDISRIVKSLIVQPLISVVKSLIVQPLISVVKSLIVQPLISVVKYIISKFVRYVEDQSWYCRVYVKQADE